jgi:glycine/D-amino acid oxidase-like deaminating enzyme
VTLIDAADPMGGSNAALGLLMAQVFHRASGRAWRLRQTSLNLWERWVAELQSLGHPLQLNRGLLLLAANPDELARQQALCEARQAMGLPFELWGPAQLADLAPGLPAAALGGLWSAADGQIDPQPLLTALLHEARRLGARILGSRVQALDPIGGGGWRLQLDHGEPLRCTTVVVCAGHGAAELLQPQGHRVPLGPVLGQAVELALEPGDAAGGWQGAWPAAVVWEGINLVPRPGGRLWLGATLEPGLNADAAALQSMADLNGHAPPWLTRATVLRRWQGLRVQPLDRPAPWLEVLAPGLLMAGCHYRNGLLLAPATATWIAETLEAD